MGPKHRTVTIVVAVIALALVLAIPIINLLKAPPESAELETIVERTPEAKSAVEILQAKCSHCHSRDVETPFYGKLPVAKAVVEADIARGLRWFDMGEQIATESGVPLAAGLAKLEYVVQRKSMPPTRYVAMHWASGLTDEDVDTLLEWIRETRAQHYGVAGQSPELQQMIIPPLPTTHEEKAEKVALGNQLFHDKRLSKDETIACASCHDLAKGGTDQDDVATGVGGAKGPINSPTVFNALFNVAQFWDGRAADLKAQAAGPVTNPIEMAATWGQVVERLNADAEFKHAFEAEYPDGFSQDTITEAIATFERTLITPNSPFDRFLQGDEKALSANAQQGWAIFQDLGCINCHCGPAMGGTSFEIMGRAKDYFAGREVTDADMGRYNVTKKETDKHKFKVPTLRNVARTFPYFHDASAKDLATAVRVMAEFQNGKVLSEGETAQLVQFLESLTGEYEGKPL